MKRTLILASLLVTAVVGASMVAAHAGGPGSRAPSGVTIEPLAHATIGKRVHAHSAGIKIRTNGPKDLLTVAITVDVGASFGWHSHPGPVIVAVASGTLALYQADDSSCARATLGPGQAFIEDGGDVHLARNEGSGPVVIYATFLARPGTTEFLTEEPDPGTCSGL